MERSGAGARSEIRPWISIPIRDSRTVAGPVGQIARAQTLRQAFGRARYIERAPVESVGRGFVRGILDIVKDHGIGLQVVRRGGGSGAQAPMELERRRFVVAT